MKKILGLVGMGALILASTGIILAKDQKDEGGVVVENKGEVFQHITTTATATSGEINIAKEPEHFNKIVLGGAIITGDSQAIADSVVIANQFTTSVKALKEVKVVNDGSKDVDQFINTKATAKSGEIELLKEPEHFNKIETKGTIMTGVAVSEVSGGVWANIFDTKITVKGVVHHAED